MSDFAWWAGVTRRRASAAIESVDTVPVGGDLLLPRDVEPLWQKGVPLDPESIDVCLKGRVLDGLRARRPAAVRR